MSDKTGVLFVCMGNICRSPLAEAVFGHKARRRGIADRFSIDSAGTSGWHVGEPPDPRARAVAARHGIELQGRARQVTPHDFPRFDHLICMDEENRAGLAGMGAPGGKLHLLLEIDPSTSMRNVPDPYGGGPDGFETVFKLVDSACDAWIDELSASVP